MKINHISIDKNGKFSICVETPVIGLTEKKKCEKCELLMELYQSTDKTPRLYWVMTEIFVMLHDGKDHCDSQP